MTTLIHTRPKTGTLTGPVIDRTGQGHISSGYLSSSGTVNTRNLIIRQVSDDQSLLQQRFAQLAEAWRNETGMYSMHTKKVAHPSYLRAVGLGSGAIPLILKELQDHGGYWYPALEALVGYSPILIQGNLSIRELKTRWLEWGQRQGYLA